MARIFLSHSSKNNAIALQFHEWLIANGWADVFLDLDPGTGLAPGQRWQEELRKAAETCEAVLFLVSPAWLASRWCLAEFLLAKQLGKKIFPILVEAVAFDELPTEMTATHQAVDLVNDPQGYTRLKEGLTRAGLSAESFSFPVGRRPYPGLEALGEQDAAVFFGRDAQIIRAMDHVRGMRDAGVERTLIILGASGAGKSSFLKAGLWPRFDRDQSTFVTLPVIRPGRAVISDPNGLAAALAAGLRNAALTSDAAARALQAPDGIRAELLADRTALGRFLAMLSTGRPTVVLSIDQGEELLNADGGAEAQIFISALADAMQTDRNILTLVSIRSNAFPQLQLHPEFSRLPHVPFSLLPMSPGSFRQIIEGPAKIAGLKLDPLLVDQLLSDTTGAQSAAADALPLLAFSLGRLHQQFGHKGGLTLGDYSSQGGRSGTIVAAVDEAMSEGQRLRQLPVGARERTELIRRTFIPHLIQVDDAGSFARRIADYDAFDDDCRAFVDLLVQKRLLVRESRTSDSLSKDTVEIAHEALIREWPQLRALVGDARDLLEWRKQIDRAYEFYASAPEADKGEALLSGLQLTRALRWVGSEPNAVSEQIRDFVIRSSLSKNRTVTRDLDRYALVTAGSAAAGLLSMLACGLALLLLTPERLLSDLAIEPPLLHKSITPRQIGVFGPLIVGISFTCVMFGLSLLHRSVDATRSQLILLGAPQIESHWLRPLMGNNVASRRATALVSTDKRALPIASRSLLGLLALAVMLTLAYQVTFLKVHDETLTWMQRAGLGLVLAAAVRTTAMSSSLGARLTGGRWSMATLATLASVAIAGCLAAVSVCVLTIPQERIELTFGLAREGPFQHRFVDRFVARNYDLRNVTVELPEGSPSQDIRFADFRGAVIKGKLATKRLDGARMAGAVIDSLETGCPYDVETESGLRDAGYSKDVFFFVVGSMHDTRPPVHLSLCGGMKGIDFKGARIKNLIAERTALERIDFRDASIETASFAGSVLSEIDFTGAAVTFPGFKRALIVNSTFDNARMPAALFTFAHVVESSFKSVRLDAASFRRAVVVESNFDGASLAMADWRQANVVSTPIFEARDLSAIDLRFSTLWNVPVVESSLRAPGQFGKGKIEHADFRGVRLAPPNIDVIAGTLPSDGGALGSRTTEQLRAAVERARRISSGPTGDSLSRLEQAGAQLMVRTSARDAVHEVFDAVLCDETLHDPSVSWPGAFLSRALERAYAGFGLRRRGNGDTVEYDPEEIPAGLDHFNGSFRKVWPIMRGGDDEAFIRRCIFWHAPAKAFEEGKASSSKGEVVEDKYMARLVKLLPAEFVGPYPFIADMELKRDEAKLKK